MGEHRILSGGSLAIDFQWTTPAAYTAKWCSAELEAALPTPARWLREVRTNCELIDALLDRPADRERRVAVVADTR